jgi:hypothetical protein
MERAHLQQERPYNCIAQEITTLILSRFFFVGFVEEMRASVRLLKAKLSSCDVRLKPPILGHRTHFNRTKGSNDSAWLNDRDPVGKRVLNAMALETALYERFHQRFLQEYSMLWREGTVGTADEISEFGTLEDWAISVCRHSKL